MMEYDKELILRMLNIWNFDLSGVDVDRIIHVPMHQYRVTTKDKTMLFVENLQCCIGLYAYNHNFGFAAHINPVYMHGDDYELNYKKQAVRFRRLNDLKNAILENYSNDETIKIGISIGCAPLGKDYPTIKMIYDSISHLVVELRLVGIKVEMLDEMYASEFILDTENSDIILPKNSKRKIR